MAVGFFPKASSCVRMFIPFIANMDHFLLFITISK